MSHQNDGALDWLMEDLVARVPHARLAVLLSGDGLAMAAHGTEGDVVDKLAAVASAFHSLARGIGAELEGEGEVRQVVVELGSTMLFVTTAAAGTRLLVVADREVDPGVMGYEMATFAKSVGTHLTTPARAPAPNPG